jgi:site-specific DNA-methyltransferase (adenine-specific)
MKYELNQIIHADCMDIMKDIPDKYFELAIVDPPYGINMANGAHSNLKKLGNKDWDIQTPDNAYFSELFRVSENQIIWGGNYFTNKLPVSRGWIFWDKKITNSTSPNFSDGELAWTSFDKILKRFVYDWIGFGYLNNPAGEKKIHPTQKPVALYRWLLQNYAKPGDKIIDTHSGSGSCAIACHLEKFDFLAIEKDEDYYKASVKRLEEIRSQGVLF